MNSKSKEKRNVKIYKTKFYKKYGKYSLRIGSGRPYTRDAQSDRWKMQKHLGSKSVRRGIQRETKSIIEEYYLDSNV